MQGKKGKIIRNKTPQILVNDKWDTWVKSGATLEDAALELLTERLEQGFWYDNWDTGNPTEQYRDRAEKIVKLQDGELAWRFLEERSDAEYEQVEVVTVR